MFLSVLGLVGIVAFVLFCGDEIDPKFPVNCKKCNLGMKREVRVCPRCGEKVIQGTGNREK